MFWGNYAENRHPCKPCNHHSTSQTDYVALRICHNVDARSKVRLRYIIKTVWLQYYLYEYILKQSWVYLRTNVQCTGMSRLPITTITPPPYHHLELRESKTGDLLMQEGSPECIFQILLIVPCSVLNAHCVMQCSIFLWVWVCKYKLLFSPNESGAAAQWYRALSRI